MYSLWRVRVTIITYSECVCVCVALVIQHAKHMRFHLWRVRLYLIFTHYLKNGTIFGKKGY